MKEIKVKVTFNEMILGTASGNPELHKDYIASNAPDAKTKQEEIEELGVDGVEKKDMTVFPRLDNGRPFLYDYQIKGFFKNACSTLRKVSGTESSKIKAFKKEIDGLVFVMPRKIQLIFDGEVGNLQRPLRASTPQGDRVALANSESCPAGTEIEFTIKLLKDDMEGVVKEWLDYGDLNGIGQWHNGGYGRFSYEIIE